VLGVADMALEPGQRIVSAALDGEVGEVAELGVRTALTPALSQGERG